MTQPISIRISSRMRRLIAAVREHAMTNYDIDGWDYVVEAWTDREIADAFGEARTEKSAIRRVKRELVLLDEARAEVVAQA